MPIEIESETARNAKRRSELHKADAVIVGAGPMGCAMAFALANQGRSVILLERWMQEPNRIVGELLQPGGVAALRKLGLEKSLEGIDAIPCHGFHVTYHGEDVVIPYPPIDDTGKVHVKVQPPANAKSLAANGHANGGANGHANGSANGHANGSSDAGKKGAVRPQGRSFHHGRFVMNLRKACAAHPMITIFETEVVATVQGEDSDAVVGVETRTKDRETGKKTPDYFFGALTIIVDGYASKFRKQFIDKTPVVRSHFYALELIDCPFPPAYFGHVIIGKAFPVLMYQIGTHETRALIDVPEKVRNAWTKKGGVHGYIKNEVLPTLPKSVQPSVEAALADGQTMRSMPNSWLPPSKQAKHAGVIVLGDAFNMRHPLTGGGMTVAFNDAVFLTTLLDPANVPDLGDAKAVHAAMAKFHWKRKSLTSIINVLAMALYSLFAAHDRQLRALQRGCFRYFEYGFVDEPVGLLGGLLHRPMVLAWHFFRVAFVAIWLNALEVCGGGVLGILMLPLALVDAVLILWKACVVFLPIFWAEAS
ncbi:squalene epoxidase [Thozetella sp. PMI_491]|nr:squalene epoxidase [Thozetella sp. PMI_491]